MYTSSTDGMRYYAIQPIAPGDPIHPSYLSFLLTLPFEERQKKLQETKDFICRCTRCSNYDDCRGLTCCKIIDNVKCSGISFRLNLSSIPTWKCITCNTVFSESEMNKSLRLEMGLIQKYDALVVKFNDAKDAMSPKEFLQIIKAVNTFGLSIYHYVSILTREMYLKWMMGVAEDLRMQSIPPQQQLQAPWGGVVSRVGLTIDAIQIGLEVIQLMECCSCCCSSIAGMMCIYMMIDG